MTESRGEMSSGPRVAVAPHFPQAALVSFCDLVPRPRSHRSWEAGVECGDCRRVCFVLARQPGQRFWPLIDKSSSLALLVIPYATRRIFIHTVNISHSAALAALDSVD